MYNPIVKELEIHQMTSKINGCFPNIDQIKITCHTQSILLFKSTSKVYNSFPYETLAQTSSSSLDCLCLSDILLNNYINKMQINFSNFEEHLSRKDKKDLYCRPLTALVATHTRTNTTDQIFNLSFLTKRKETQGYTTRLQANDKKAYRNIRSASLYETLYPCVPQDKTCKLQIINNACLKKVFFSKPHPIRKSSSIFDVNATLTQHMQTDITKKENQLPKYHCKKLKVIKGKPRMHGKILSETNNQEDLWGKEGIASVIGTKLL